MLFSLVLLFKPWIVAALPAYAGLWLLHLSTYTTFPKWVLIFYGIATAMVVGIRFMSPKGEPDGKLTGNLYIGLGALMGCLLGMLIEPLINKIPYVELYADDRAYSVLSALLPPEKEVLLKHATDDSFGTVNRRNNGN